MQFLTIWIILFLSLTHGNVVVDDSPLEIRVFEETSGFTFKVTRQTDVTDGWFAIGFAGYFHSSNNAMEGALAFVCAPEAITVYSLQSAFRPESTWVENVVPQEVAVIDSQRTCEFKLDIPPSMLQTMIYAYSTDCFDIEDLDCPWHGANRGRFSISPEQVETIREDIDELQIELAKLKQAVSNVLDTFDEIPNPLTTAAPICGDRSLFEECKSGHTLSKYMNGCEIFHKGRAQDKSGCHRCFPLERSYSSCSLDECHAACEDLYENGDNNTKMCRDGCISMRDLWENYLQNQKVPHIASPTTTSPVTTRAIAAGTTEMITSSASEVEDTGACSFKKALIDCKASHTTTFYRNGCEVFYNGWDKGNDDCPHCRSLPRSYEGCDIVECVDACNDLYEPWGYKENCWFGCNKMREMDEYHRNLEDPQNVMFEKMKSVMTKTTRELLLTQFRLEQETRMTGDSGIKGIRSRTTGTKPYYRGGYAETTLAMHDHANYLRTVGMGELTATINGVTFSTRHNDYMLKKRATNTSQTEYDAHENLDFPEVPPEVLHYENVEDQVVEMKRWFKAFHDQDYSERDYRDYFKPVLCYLEGNWIDDEDEIEDPFQSERHTLNTETWEEQHDVEQYLAASGNKYPNENSAFYPTKIVSVEVDDDGIPKPKFAKWDFRILCQPLKADVPTSRFHLDVNQDQMAAHFLKKPHLSGEERMKILSETRYAKFVLNPKLSNDWKESGKNSFSVGKHRRSYLDELMEQIPGLSGPNEFIVDPGFHGYGSAKQIDDSTKELNTAMYTRYYGLESSDASGRKTQRRGFFDENLFAATTNHSKVPSNGYRFDKWSPKVEQRWSYAIPLEIIYMTPLAKWNPFELQKFDNERAFLEANSGKSGENPEDPMFGYSEDAEFKITPASLFGKANTNGLADTGLGGRHIRNSDGLIGKVVSSGTRIITPRITVDSKSFGVRLRYPIFSYYDENTRGNREAHALHDLIVEEQKRENQRLENHLARVTAALNEVLKMVNLDEIDSDLTPVTISGNSDEADFVGEWVEETFPGLTLKTSAGAPGDHHHDVIINWEQYVALMNDDSITVQCERWDIGGPHDHSHALTFKINSSGAPELEFCDNCEALADPHDRVFNDPNFEDAFTS